MADAPRVTVRLPEALVRLFDGAQTEVEIDAGDVRGAIEALDAHWPGMRDRLCTPGPKIRRNINIFVRGKRASLDTQLAPGEVVWVMTAVIG